MPGKLSISVRAAREDIAGDGPKPAPERVVLTADQIQELARQGEGLEITSAGPIVVVAFSPATPPTLYLGVIG